MKGWHTCKYIHMKITEILKNNRQSRASLSLHIFHKPMVKNSNHKKIAIVLSLQLCPLNKNQWDYLLKKVMWPFPFIYLQKAFCSPFRSVA